MNIGVWRVAKFSGAEAVVTRGISNGTYGTVRACSTASSVESRTLSAGVPFQRNSAKDAAITRKGKEEE